MAMEQDSVERQVLTDRAVIASYVGLLGLGILLAGYGVALPSFVDQFGITMSIAGFPIALQSGAAVIGVLAVQPILRLWGNRHAWGISYGLCVVGALVIALSPQWNITLGGATIAGFGLGGADALTSQLILLSRNASTLAVGHASFGIGTIIAPLFSALLGSEGYRWVFIGASVAAVVPIIALREVRSHPTPHAQADPVQVSSQIRSAQWYRSMRWILIIAFLILYIAHFGAQSGIGTWEPTLLLSAGYSDHLAGIVTSGYWLMMVLSRFLMTPLLKVASPMVIVLISTIGLSIAVAVATIGQYNILGYLVAGFFIGPIFPLGLAVLQEIQILPGSCFAYIIAGAMVGAAIAPPVIGWLVAKYSIEFFPLIVLILSMSTVLVSFVIFFLDRKITQEKFLPSEALL